jgi:polysaccharide pyruvyl transferase WcaK-like protein
VDALPKNQVSKELSIAIIGGTLWGNRGAEAMLVTTIGKIREIAPETTFFVYSYYPFVDRKLCHDKKIIILDGRPLSLVLKLFIPGVIDCLLRLIGLRLQDSTMGEEARQLRSSTVLLDIGGIVFADGRLVFLLYNVFTIWPAFLFDVPVVKLSQALGPFRSWINSSLGKLFISRCEKVFARGQDTYNHLRGLGLSTKTIAKASDIVFSYSAEYSLTEENTDRVQELLTSLKETEQPVAAIIPSSLLYSKNEVEREQYLSTLERASELFLQHGYALLFLPNATREGCDKKRNNDIIVVSALRSRLISDDFRDRIFFVEFDLNTEAIQHVLGNAQLLVTSRFHGMVAGLSLGIPTGVIGWGHKYREVLAEFDLADLAADYRSATEQVLRTVEHLIDASDSIRKKISAGLPEVRKSSASQFDYLRSLLAETSHTK